VTEPSPTARRREVGSLLRDHRERVGLKLGEAADRAGVSSAKLSRLERGLRGLNVADVQRLCALYGLSEERTQELVAATRASREPGWWESFSGLSPAAPLFFGLELAADRIEEFDAFAVPGVLQTADYVTALLAGAGGAQASDRDRLAELVEARMRRSSVLLPRREKSFHFVVDESALRRRIGSAAVMADQCEALALRADDDNIRLQVLPLATGAHPGFGGGFSIQILDGARQGDTVFLERLTGDELIEHPGQVARYREAFRVLVSRARDKNASQRLIRAVGRQWRAAQRSNSPAFTPPTKSVHSATE